MQCPSGSFSLRVWEVWEMPAGGVGMGRTPRMEGGGELLTFDGWASGGLLA